MEIGSIIDILRILPESDALKPGDLLNVKVLEVFENQRAVVDLGRFRALAEITFPVVAGDELRVKVREAEGRLSLQLVPSPGEPALPAARAAGPVPAAALDSLHRVWVAIDQLADAAQTLPDFEKRSQLPAELRPVTDALRQFLEPFEPGLGAEILARRLKGFCENSGLFLETHLAAALTKTADGTGGMPAERILASDLKARLAMLTVFFESGVGRSLVHGRREFAGLARAAAELLTDIRTGQEQLAKANAEAHPFQMVQFALPMPDARCRAELKIGYGRRPAAGREEGYRAAILLELDRMGAVRADLILQGRHLNISVFVSEAGMRDLVRRHASEVHDALAPFFERVAFQVSVSSRKIAAFASEEWRAPGETQVDVRV
jgi:hypothetical protein